VETKSDSTELTRVQDTVDLTNSKQ